MSMSVRPARCGLLASVLLPVAACAHTSPPAPSLSFSPPPVLSSAYSMSASVSSISVAGRTPDRHDLVVRPDTLALNFGVRVTEPTPQAAMAALRALLDAIGQRMAADTGGAATLRPCDFRSSLVKTGAYSSQGGASPEPGPGSGPGQGPPRTLSATGAVEIALAPDADYWARARLLAAIDDGVRALSVQEPEGPGKKSVTFSAPSLEVKDVERYRPELSRRWVNKVRAFAGPAATLANAPLRVGPCDPPTAITQRILSVEEVALALPVTCKLDVAR